MKILSFNQVHDITSAFIDNGKLIFAYEAEKDTGRRHSIELPPSLILQSFQMSSPPDAIAFSGWHKPMDNFHTSTDAGYHGIGSESKIHHIKEILGKQMPVFSSSHERSHIMCSYGLSDFPQGQPCYVLVWEGTIGAFYYIDENLNIEKIGDVFKEPGNKYAFLYALADPAIPVLSTYIRISDAGKLMALSAYGEDLSPSKDELNTIKHIMQLPTIFNYPNKYQMQKNKYFNIGVTNQKFKNLARKFSDALFEVFYKFAKNKLNQKLPLLISGGCGLNCDWNSQWKECGLFTDVFVPPCTNDTGVALGAAIDAQFYYTGNAKIKWSVYSGSYFLNDTEVSDLEGFAVHPLNLEELSKYLADGKIFAWVQGREEMGPRALGNRSIIAAPFSTEIRDQLNRIKQRESFRPIAPICLEEDFDMHFKHHGPSPFMLYFQKVKSPELAGITHIDGSARAQTVNEYHNPEVYALLKEFKRHTGFGVLCNTSLNFKGYGFINRLSDLARFVRTRKLNGFVIGDKMYLNESLNGFNLQHEDPKAKMYHTRYPIF